MPSKIKAVGEDNENELMNYNMEMKKDKAVFWSQRGKSFRFAFEGVHAFFRSEQNAVIHLFATLLVIFLPVLAGLCRTGAVIFIPVEMDREKRRDSYHRDQGQYQDYIFLVNSRDPGGGRPVPDPFDVVYPVV